ncbi:MAG: serine hydrolase domain-containing protein [Erysipelotrichaceae bacterium]|nr:serine hydrolase domain-containing protein [Erysipelotrichaceae bacterium]
MEKTLSSRIRDQFISSVEKDSKVKNAFLLVYNGALGIHVNEYYGTNSTVDQPYYIASIGKVFTSVIIGQLVEKKLIGYEDKVLNILGNSIVDGLHTVKGINYISEVTIRHLLNHTSGIGDYFSDKPIHGKPMLELIHESPYKHYSPLEIVQWSKTNIKPRFKPGKGFHYSDTGYHLLGLVIEKILNMPLAEVMEKNIFSPLDMKNTALASNEKSGKIDEGDICDVYWGENNVKDYSIFKDDYAGGGIITTSSDLLLFVRAIINHQIINESTLNEMTKWSKYSSVKLIGIAYGLGLMYLKSTPLLFPKKFSSFGHIGSIGSFMFYNPTTKTYLIGSVNRFQYHRKSMNIMFNALKEIMKIYLT